MEKYNVVIALERLGEAKAAWNAARREFNEQCELMMRRLINEAAVNMMSAEEVAHSSGMTVRQVREWMRYNNLNPKNGKRLLSEQAAKTLAENAALMDKDPHEFDLMSPLAYLPMGKVMREELDRQRTPSVTEVDSKIQWHLNREFLDALTEFGETYRTRDAETELDVIAVIERLIEKNS